MGEDSDPLTTEQGPASISHREILIAMAALIGVLAGVGFIFGGLFFGLGVVFGGVLSYANYLWLKRSMRGIFERAGDGRAGVLAAKYSLRYVAIGAVLLLIYLTGAFPLAAVILGLAGFALAVVLQGLKNIFLGIF